MNSNSLLDRLIKKPIRLVKYGCLVERSGLLLFARDLHDQLYLQLLNVVKDELFHGLKLERKNWNLLSFYILLPIQRVFIFKRLDETTCEKVANWKKGFLSTLSMDLLPSSLMITLGNKCSMFSFGVSVFICGMFTSTCGERSVGLSNENVAVSLMHSVGKSTIWFNLSGLLDSNMRLHGTVALGFDIPGVLPKEFSTFWILISQLFGGFKTHLFFWRFAKTIEIPSFLHFFCSS